MTKILHWVFLHRYFLAVIVILTVTLVFRFYLYSLRWGLGYDQAHDVIVARYALEHGKIPLLGPFSSAGPFQTGGEWYWLIMLGIVIFPFWIQGPWVFLTLTQVLFVLIMVSIGKELINKRAALLMGLLAAFSPSEISQSTNLTNQAPLSLLSALSILTMVLFIKKRSSLFIFLLGFFISLATSIHMQGASLYVLVVLTVLVARPSFKHMLLLVLGIVLPFFPIFLAEYHYGFFNTRGFLTYYLHDQYKIPLQLLGRRWTTYLGIIWPNTIGSAIGGFKPFGYLIVGLWIFILPFFLFKNTITKQLVIILASFLIFVIALRFVHTPLFDSYFMFAHPFMFIFAGISLYVLTEHKKTRLLGLLFTGIILVASIFQTNAIIQKSDTLTNSVASSWYKLLRTNYPNQKVSVYDYSYKTTSLSFPLVLYLQYNHKIDPNGYRIGFGTNHVPLDVQSSSSAQLKELGWIRITPDDVYNATEQWYANKK